MENTITVFAKLVDGSEAWRLSLATPKDALEEYFMPDTSPPVSVLFIEVTDKEGKTLTLTIDPSDVSFRTI